MSIIAFLLICIQLQLAKGNVSTYGFSEPNCKGIKVTATVFPTGVCQENTIISCSTNLATSTAFSNPSCAGEPVEISNLTLGCSEVNDSFVVSQEFVCEDEVSFSDKFWVSKSYSDLGCEGIPLSTMYAIVDVCVPSIKDWVQVRCESNYVALTESTEATCHTNVTITETLPYGCENDIQTNTSAWAHCSRGESRYIPTAVLAFFALFLVGLFVS